MPVRLAFVSQLVPKRRNAHCRHCGRHRSVTGTLSRRGICADCGPERVRASVLQLKAQRGPMVDWWAYKMAASVGLAPLDDVPPRP